MAKKSQKPKTLPESYLKWLDSLSRNRYIMRGDREWHLESQKGLAKVVNIDGRKATYIEQTKLFVTSIAEATGESSTFDESGNKVPFSRIEKFLTIGCDNEDVLCVDPYDKYSVWCYRPCDGGDVEKLAATLAKWMREEKSDATE